MITAREMHAHEDVYHGFVKLIATFTATVLVMVAIVLALIT